MKKVYVLFRKSETFGNCIVHIFVKPDLAQEYMAEQKAKDPHTEYWIQTEYLFDY